MPELQSRFAIRMPDGVRVKGRRGVHFGCDRGTGGPPAVPNRIIGTHRLVVDGLHGKGQRVRVLSRRPHEPKLKVELVRGDLAKNEALERALDGVTTIVHCASSRTGDATATQNLVRGASAAMATTSSAPRSQPRRHGLGCAA
jgi:hypothetical protein